MAPPAGLEPTTKWLHLIPKFPVEVDYLIIPKIQDVGRLKSLLVEYPHLLVSARSCLLFLLIQQASLKITLSINLGFLEFTRFFNHSYLWKLQNTCMNFTMTIAS